MLNENLKCFYLHGIFSDTLPLESLTKKLQSRNFIYPTHFWYLFKENLMRKWTHLSSMRRFWLSVSSSRVSHIVALYSVRQCWQYQAVGTAKLFWLCWMRLLSVAWLLLGKPKVFYLCCCSINGGRYIKEILEKERRNESEIFIVKLIGSG
jgi:hypothetical protein